MCDEPPKKKVKRKKQVSWDMTPSSGISADSNCKNKSLNHQSPKNEVCFKNDTVVEESEHELIIDIDREDGIPPAIRSLEQELEVKLEEKAKKNNLSVKNVKNILKAVITNKDVVEMVNTSIKGETFDNYQPKFTRSKTKELLESYDLEQCSSKVKSDYAYILDQELSEDSSDDEEYTPNEESDEENRTVETLPESPMPDSPYFSSVCGDESGAENIENIGQRTRSKLSLSETPLETIEQQFIPPDITTDMYDTECDNEDWLDFLKGIQNPLDRTVETVEDDNDPEYNVMVDDYIENIDFEELRHDRAVKVTKAELHALMNEWFGCDDFSSEEDAETEKLKKSPKNSPFKSKDKSQSSTPPSLSNQKNNLQLPLDELFKTINLYKRDNFFSKEQYCLLIQQIQQHIQLLLQTFLLTYKHPYVETRISSDCKEMICTLNCLATKNKSSFNVLNMTSSINLMQNWEAYMSNSNNSTPVVQFMEKEFLNGDMNYKKQAIVPAKVPQQIMSFCADSTAFIFPLLLPNSGVIFTSNKSSRADYCCYEDHLIALAFEEFTKEFKSTNNKSEPGLMELSKNVCTVLMPHRQPRSVSSHVKWLLKQTGFNPIKYFFHCKEAPPIKHFVINVTAGIKLKDQPQQLIPPNWKKHLFKKPCTYHIITKKKS